TDFDRPFAGHLNRIDSAKNPSWFMYPRLLRAEIGVYHFLRITKQDDYSLSTQKSEIILRWKNMLLEQHALAAHFVHELGAVFPNLRMPVGQIPDFARLRHTLSHRTVLLRFPVVKQRKRLHERGTRRLRDSNKQHRFLRLQTVRRLSLYD